MPVPEEGESIKVPIAFNLLDVGELTTRVSPDDNLSYGGNVRPNIVNAVNVYVYSRDADGSYRDYADGFTLGYTYTLPVQDLDEEAWPRYVASGEIEMSSSKEYRINAVAYNTSKSGDNSFQLNGSFFKQAEIELINPTEQVNKQDQYHPELFFGTVLFEDTDSIFTYERTKNNKAGLICTILGIVIATETESGDGTMKTEYSYARLRLKETSSVPGVPYYPEDNEDITTKTVPDDDGLGTGIIPDNDLPTDPEHPEEDDPLYPFRVCFMRNNYYKIEGNFKRLNQQKYTLRVIVNPNWDQKVSLTLEEASGDSNNGGNTN